FEVIPWIQHRPVGKESGITSYIERCNNTLRQRCARLVRKTISFSKKISHHIGMIKYFICHYNQQRALHI
ncbi:MAG: IS1 family transposase, partial [Chlamydia sp.]